MIDLPHTLVLLPAEKAELAQLEKHAHRATLALCSENVAPAYPALMRKPPCKLKFINFLDLNG